jgi:hypothetical protein
MCREAHRVIIASCQLLVILLYTIKEKQTRSTIQENWGLGGWDSKRKHVTVTDNTKSNKNPKLKHHSSYTISLAVAPFAIRYSIISK